MFTKHLRCVHANTHEFRSRAVFMRLHLDDQRAAQAGKQSADKVPERQGSQVSRSVSSFGFRAAAP
jgi:hypothetical protein